jgi:hypothetical protein
VPPANEQSALSPDNTTHSALTTETASAFKPTHVDHGDDFTKTQRSVGIGSEVTGGGIQSSGNPADVIATSAKEFKLPVIHADEDIDVDVSPLLDREAFQMKYDFFRSVEAPSGGSVSKEIMDEVNVESPEGSPTVDPYDPSERKRLVKTDYYAEANEIDKFKNPLNIHMPSVPPIEYVAPPNDQTFEEFIDEDEMGIFTDLPLAAKPNVMETHSMLESESILMIQSRYLS